MKLEENTEKKIKNKNQLFELLQKALKHGELITAPDDPRKFHGNSFIERTPRTLVVVVEESKSGENLTYFDIEKSTFLTKSEFVARIKEGMYPEHELRNINGQATPVAKKDGKDSNNLG